MMAGLLRFLGLEPEDPHDSGEGEAIAAIADALGTLEPGQAQFYAAFAYLLARVAGADLRIDDQEERQMERILVQVAGIPEDESELVIRIAGTQMHELGATHNYLVTRRFGEIGSEADKIRLLECLCAVAAADDTITGAESAEIISIAQELGLDRTQALAVRSQWKDKLAEFKRLPGETS
ncbi:MAG: TerB family tellurite resistance protein [Deltaproteobacteria bacterium]|nr:TerB family tellurite resistance protein [Deltaproteobacteria bacterium]